MEVKEIDSLTAVVAAFSENRRVIGAVKNKKYLVGTLRGAIRRQGLGRYVVLDDETGFYKKAIRVYDYSPELLEHLRENGEPRENLSKESRDAKADIDIEIGNRLKEAVFPEGFENSDVPHEGNTEDEDLSDW